MSKGMRFGQGVSVFPVQPPKDIGTLTTDTLYVDLRDANWVSFLVNLGNMTSDVTDVVNISASVSTDGSTTNVNVAFSYRLSSASATNTWGAVTAATSDGTTDIAAASAQDNCSILIDIDPAIVGKAVDGANSVRLDIVATNCPICLASTTAFVEHKYSGNTMSSTF